MRAPALALAALALAGPAYAQAHSPRDYAVAAVGMLDLYGRRCVALKGPLPEGLAEKVASEAKALGVDAAQDAWTRIRIRTMSDAMDRDSAVDWPAWCDGALVFLRTPR
ncbi:hypothetical protein [uncultured Alsobacter sp.]|uniref:hypothetical protein n=1 Tax=uncultured Alsobacter sp. TaxID=1748258 RepID=UPI0025FE7808|nr:hypothetical protein [uncultured Alsobacter sp.]